MFCCGCSIAPVEFNTTIGKEKTVLRVIVKSVEVTDHYPENACTEDCIVWNFWFRYKAKVKNVIRGEYTDRYITFVNLQHAAYRKGIVSDWFVSLDELNNPETKAALKADYYVVEHTPSFNGIEGVNRLVKNGSIEIRKTS